MKWIEAYDLNKIWAGKRDCQETLPLLVRKLIRTTSSSIQSIRFPAGESVAIGGWDGILVVLEETEYLPEGISLWEFGTNKDIKGKADEDYSKRTSKPLGFNPAESTFIFVTPRIWTKSKEWRDEKLKEGIWKEILVIDAEILEEWIEIAPTVGAWLSKHIGKFPDEGIQSSDDFWEEWISGEKFKLNPEILLGGREKEKEKIIDSIKKPSITPVQGISREESLAFIIACFKDNPAVEEDFFSRSIIIDNLETFRKLSTQDKPLILIPRFEDNGIINRALIKGHTIIVPLGADSSEIWKDKIPLSLIDKDSFVSALEKTGMKKEFAERYSRESARNLTILRRQLEFNRTIPKWAMAENVLDIIPALLVGRWDEEFESDKRIVSKMANDSYENYAKKLTKWVYTQDSPIIKIGSTWRLTSPFDTWTNASKYINKADFAKLHKILIEVLTEIDPAFELPVEQRYMASLYGKKRLFSSWIREGLIQSLILTSIFGDKLRLDLPLNADIWVDKIVKELLNSKNLELWKSFQGILPLIAEASPTEFLNAIEEKINIEKSPVLSLFEEEPGFISKQTYHTGLLWALEGLAWFPKYLSRVSLILGKLSLVDPGGSIINRPINSLIEIFRPWNYQTLASYDERRQVLELLMKRHFEIAWNLLITLMPKAGLTEYANPTHKPRWLIFEIETDLPKTKIEVNNSYSLFVDLLLMNFDYTENKLAQLVDISTKLTKLDLERTLAFVSTTFSMVKDNTNLVWDRCRKILYNHKSYPDARWALPEELLVHYQALYEMTMPKTEVDQVMWLFENYSPEFPEGFIHGTMSYEKEDKIILEKRVKGLGFIYQTNGLEKVLELSKIVKEVGIFGDTFGYILNNEEEIIMLCNFFEKNEEQSIFLQSFIFRKTILNDMQWTFNLFDKLKVLGSNTLFLVKLVIPLNQQQKLWDFIDMQEEEINSKYWETLYPRFYYLTIEEKIFGLKKLVKYKRYFSALNNCSNFIECLPTSLILDIMQKAATETSNEKIKINDYQVNKLFEEIYKRDDIEENVIIHLEWLYLPILTSFGNERGPQRLHEELSKNSMFFIEILSFLSKKHNSKENYLDEEQIRSRAKQAYKLLESWKIIPGIDSYGKIDLESLRNWINEIKRLSSEKDCIELTDIYIGKILAQYPEEKDKPWPPEEICEILEELNSEKVNIEFSCTTKNKRGSTTRGVYDGGIIEKENAKYYLDNANIYRNRFIVITQILDDIAKSYEYEASKRDEEVERLKLEY